MVNPDAWCGWCRRNKRQGSTAGRASATIQNRNGPRKARNDTKRNLRTKADFKPLIFADLTLIQKLTSWGFSQFTDQVNFSSLEVISVD